MNDGVTREYLAEATATIAEELTADFMPVGERRVFDVRGLKPFVRAGKKRVKVYLRGHDLPWIPCTTMLRVLKHEEVWGDDPARWLGRQVELYIDPKVRNPDGEMTGGIRISGVSHIPRDLSPKIKLGRKWGPWSVRRLGQEAPPATSFYDQLLALINSGAATKAQVHAALGQRRAAEVPASEHAAILARLQAVQQTVPDSAAQEGEE